MKGHRPNNNLGIPKAFFHVSGSWEEQEKATNEYYFSLTPAERIEIAFNLINQYFIMKNIKPQPLRGAKIRIITQEELNKEKIGY